MEFCFGQRNVWMGWLTAQLGNLPIATAITDPWGSQGSQGTRVEG